MRQAECSELPKVGSIDCDVCIIGTGPAGATIARELSDTRLKILLLESGAFERQANADELNTIESVGWPRVMDQWLVRNRIVGGSSHTWSGRCVPFDTIDFERRDWIPHSGWPLRLEDCAPYLDRAAVYLGLSIGTGFTGERFWRLAGRKQPKPELITGDLEPFFWQFSRDDAQPSDYMRFGRHLAGKLGNNVTLIRNATVVQINVNETGRVTAGVEAAAADGTRRILSAKRVILCAGGIENARLLLASNRVMPEGLGNTHDQVGRYLMDHLRGPAARFEIKGSQKIQKRFGHYRFKNGQVFAHGFRLSETVQRNEQLLNCTAWLEGAIAEGDPFDAIKRLLRRQGSLSRNAINVVKNGNILAAGLRDYFVSRQGLPRKIERLDLICMTEQIPDPESRVTLSPRTDRFGVPLPRIGWRVSTLEQQTMARMAEVAAAAFGRMGYKQPVLAPWVRGEAAFPASFQDVAHPTGTTRMGQEKASSVVNVNGAVHGVEGLYVAGSSTFPTSSHANPTQMVVALALRLADNIKQLA